MKYSIIIVVVLALSCTSTPELSDVNQLKGFWEIEKAETPYGVKSYKMNQMVDYIKVDDNKGFRKKMQPSLLGNYKSSKNREYFEIEKQDDSLVMVYKNDYDTWTETLLQIEEDKFVVKNQQSFIYTYRRHETKNIDLDEE